MHRHSLAPCVFFLQVSIVLTLYAERPPERREEATYVVTGTVDKVYLQETESYQHYTVKIRVEQVDRGEGLQPGDIFYAGCFRRRQDAPPEPSPQGHTVIPRTGQRVRVYVNGRGGENEGVYPNWADVLDNPPRGGRSGKRAGRGVLQGRRGRVVLPDAVSTEVDPTNPEAAAYPGATQFCSGDAVGEPGPDGEGGGHISWEAYYSDDKPPQVVDHYMARFGLKNHQTSGDSHVWHFSPNTGADRMIEVSPTTAKGPWSDNDPPPSSARTIILISVIAR